MTEENILYCLRKGIKDAAVMRAIGMGLLFLMHTIVARTIGAKNYGVFSYTLAISTIFAMLMSMGWPTALIRFTAQYEENKKWGHLRGALVRSHQLTLVNVAVAVMILLGIPVFFRLRPEINISIRCSALLLPLISFASLRRSVFQGLKRVRSSIVPDQVILPLGMIAGIYLFKPNGPTDALLVYSGAAFTVLIASYLWLLRYIPKRVINATPAYHTRYWVLTALPLVFSGISQLLMNRTDMLLLGIMTDMNDVGIYSAANRIANLNVFFMTSINIIGAPMLAGAFYNGRKGDFGAIIRKTMLWSMLGALPLFAIMLAFPNLILSVFGSEFTRGGSILRILAAGQFVNASTGLVGSALTMTGGEKIFAGVTAGAAVFNLVSNVIGILLWGVTGAAIATALTIALFNVTLFWVVIQRLKLTEEPEKLI